MNATMIVWNGIPALTRGVGITLILVISSLCSGLLVGVGMGISHVYAPRAIRAILSVLDRILRGFPAIVLLFLLYFGLGSLPSISIPPLVAVITVLGLRSAAYQAQIYRGALLMIDDSQLEAAHSLGMSLPRAVWSILLPQAARFSIPSLSNEYSIVLKDTALAFTVGVVDLMSRAKFLALRSRETLLVYVIVACAYFILTHAGIALFRLLERSIAIPGCGQTSSKGVVR